MRAHFIFVPLAAAFLAGGATAGPVAVTIVADRDNTLYEPDSDVLNSNGAGVSMFAGLTGHFGLRRAMVRFDVADAVPAGAQVVSAKLVLHVSRGFPLTTESFTTVHRLAADWGEGTSDAGDPGGFGAEATPGDATWDHRFYSDTLWATPGGDFVSDASATAPTGLIGFVEFSSALTVADVQAWLDAPEQNFGWIIRGDEQTLNSSRRYDTRESPDEGFRPRLEIEYTVGCAADFDGDGFVTGVDYDLYVQAFEAGETSADFDGDGFLTGIDFDLYVLAFEAGCG